MHENKVAVWECTAVNKIKSIIFKITEFYALLPLGESDRLYSSSGPGSYFFMTAKRVRLAHEVITLTY